MEQLEIESAIVRTFTDRQAEAAMTAFWRRAAAEKKDKRGAALCSAPRGTVLTVSTSSAETVFVLSERSQFVCLQKDKTSTSRLYEIKRLELWMSHTRASK